MHTEIDCGGVVLVVYRSLCYYYDYVGCNYYYCYDYLGYVVTITLVHLHNKIYIQNVLIGFSCLIIK